MAAFYQGRTKSIVIILQGGRNASAFRVLGVRWITGVSLLIVLSDDRGNWLLDVDDDSLYLVIIKLSCQHNGFIFCCHGCIYQNVPFVL